MPRKEGEELFTVGDVELKKAFGGMKIVNIPSDEPSGIRLEMTYILGDVVLTMHGSPSPEETFVVLPMRLRGSGGYNCDMPYYLGAVPEAFRETEGQLPEQDFLEPFPPTGYTDFYGTEIVVNDDPEKPWIDIKGMIDDDDPTYNPDPLQRPRRMDLRVDHDGKVTLGLRNLDLDVGASMVFETGENGGKYPILTDTFTKIAKSVAGIE